MGRTEKIRWCGRWAGRAAALGLVFCIGAGGIGNTYASASRQQIERERDEAQEGLNEASQAASEAQANRGEAQSQVNALSEELTDLLSEIALLEQDMEAKQQEIDQAEMDYEAAKEREQQQYEAMKKRIKYMYERGDTEFLDVLLKVRSMSELLNKSEYIESIYNYDRQKLLEYQETKQQVVLYQEQLDAEMQEMEGMEVEYAEQQSALEDTIARKRQEVADFDEQLKAAQAAVEEYTRTIAQKNEEIRRKEEEERKQREEEERRRQEAERQAQEEASRQAAAQQGGSVSSSSPSSSGTSSSANPAGPGASGVSKGPAAYKSSGGTAAGREIADYALKFVGNPYVYGGTSLTNGADCSGFVQSVYAHFGYSLPRTSSEQRSAGTGVDYSEAQAGDIICYAGHVGIYIGNGNIVHASNAATGIKVSTATYRSIMSVRRIIQ